MENLTLEETKKRYSLISRECTCASDINSKFVMMKNSRHKEEYFKVLAILGTEFSLIYSSFERKFEVWYEINKLTREVKGAQINTNGFISERSIVKNKDCVYIKLFYSKTESDALAEYDRLNSK